MVRASGHLVFEPAWASYYLLARDIERLDGFRPAAKPLAAIIADNHRREQATSLAPAELPGWVQQMAPPEVRSPKSGERQPAAMAATTPQMGGAWELLADAEAAVAYPEAEPALAGMSDELINFLSHAMDSDVEVEITSEIMSDLNETGRTERLSPEVLEALDLFEASVGQPSPAEDALERPPVSGAALTSQELDEALADVAQALAAIAVKPPASETVATPEPLAPEAIAAQPEAAETAVTEATAVVTAVEEAPEPAPAAGDQSRAGAGKNKSGEVIPWYVALLVIVVVIIILAALVYLVLFPDSLPFDLSLSLPDEFPLIQLSR